MDRWVPGGREQGGIQRKRSILGSIQQGPDNGLQPVAKRLEVRSRDLTALNADEFVHQLQQSLRRALVREPDRSTRST